MGVDEHSIVKWENLSTSAHKFRKIIVQADKCLIEAALGDCEIVLRGRTG